LLITTWTTSVQKLGEKPGQTGVNQNFTCGNANTTCNVALARHVGSAVVRTLRQARDRRSVRRTSPDAPLQRGAPSRVGRTAPPLPRRSVRVLPATRAYQGWLPYHGAHRPLHHEAKGATYIRPSSARAHSHGCALLAATCHWGAAVELHPSLATTAD
jgi:hypothetical protein